MSKLNRRQFLKSMFAGAALLAVPKELIPELNPVFEFRISDTGSISMDQDWFAEHIIRPAAYKLAQAVDDHITKSLIDEYKLLN